MIRPLSRSHFSAYPPHTRCEYTTRQSLPALQYRTRHAIPELSTRPAPSPVRVPHSANCSLAQNPTRHSACIVAPNRRSVLEWA
eukprot:10968-Rhodomonas_salina.5